MRTGRTPPKTLVANGVNQFLDHVQNICRCDGWFPEEDQWGPWFRGHQKADWTLKPKLYRSRDFREVRENDVEDEIREEFIRRAPILCETMPSGSERREEWGWYFMMQHYGAATRLLDWTEGALIALYFAVRSNPGDSDAAVWVLDPYKLNKRVIGKEWVIPPSAVGVERDAYVKKVQNWLPRRFTKMRSLPLQPVAIDSTHVVRRISSQHSCFTIHGTDEMALEKLHGDSTSCLAKIVIQRSKVNDIMKDLRIYGINEATIFPDLDGLGRSINARWDIRDHTSSGKGGKQK